MVIGSICPVNELLQKYKSTFLTNFINKWSAHQHFDECQSCNLCLVMDGNWKVGRPKCLCGDVITPSPEFGDLNIGCVQVPNRNSYYCNEHKDMQVYYKFNDTKIAINPNLIQTVRKRKYYL
jgi:hypothetical protein